MDKADIDYEAERDRRDMERVEEIRRVTNGMVFVLNRKEIMHLGDIQVIYPVCSTTELDVLIRNLYSYNFIEQNWLIDGILSSGLLQIYNNTTGKLVSEVTIRKIPNLRIFMDKFEDIEDCLIDWILEYARLWGIWVWMSLIFIYLGL